MSRFWPGVLLLLVLSLVGNVFIGKTALETYRQLWLERIGLSALTAAENEIGHADIVYVGDSRIAGWKPLPALDDLSTVNRGVGGQTSAMVLERLAGDVLVRAPRVVVLQVGINDLKVIGMFPDREDEIFAACEANIRSIVSSITTSGARVLLLTVIPAGESLMRRLILWSDRVDMAIEELNERLLTMENDSVLVIDCGRVLGLDGRLSSAHADGFLHLNASGYERLSESILAPLQDLIGR